MLINFADANEPTMVQFKVGRSGNPVKRCREWAQQCKSKEHILRGYWPPPHGGLPDSADFMRGRERILSRAGPYSYRAERLVHLELSDLMNSQAYLLDGFPNVGRGLDPGDSPMQQQICVDCTWLY